MKVEEESGQLLEQVRRLSRRVEELAARVRDLEAEVASGRKEAPPPAEEREGDFGPAVKRSEPVHHQNAVNRALALLGVVPPEAQVTKSHQLTSSYQRALERVRNLGGDVEEVRPAGADANVVPLPELPAPPGETDAFVEADAPPVELGNAIPIDLARPSRRGRVIDVLLLLAEVAFVAGLFVLLPGVHAVIAVVFFVALLGAPWWGPLRPTFTAHARFFALVVLVRCLFADILGMGVAQPWLNPRFGVMLFGCMPAVVGVMLGRYAWGVLAFAVSAVFGAAVGAETGAAWPAVSLGAVMFGALILYRAVK